MRRSARVDANQAEIIAALRRIGCSVQPLHMVGGGCPDLLVGFRQRNYLIEVKDGNKPPSERALNAEQQQWHQHWIGQVVVVQSVEDALRAVGAKEVLSDKV